MTHEERAAFAAALATAVERLDRADQGTVRVGGGTARRDDDKMLGGWWVPCEVFVTDVEIKELLPTAARVQVDGYRTAAEYEAEGGTLP